MTTQYAGDSNAFPKDLPLPDDSAAPKAAEVNPFLEGLADRSAWLRSKLGQIAALTFQTSVGTSNAFNVLKYSETLKRWFGCASTPVNYLVSTQQVLVWPAVTDVVAPALTGASIWDFDIDSAGNLLAVDQAIDNIRKRTAAGAWSAPISDGDTTAEPNILWEPVTGNWILAFSTGAALHVRTSADLWTTRTDRVAPTFPGAARVTLGTNGTGRVVMQGFSGTDTYFSFSDDGGVTWSAPSTHALGFAYSTAGTRHHPRPVWNGESWVAVAMNGMSSTCVLKSADGNTWTVAATLTNSSIMNIAGLGGLVFGVTAGSGTVHSADNGVTWRHGEGTFTFSAAIPRGVARTNSRFVILAIDRIFPGVGILEGGAVVT